MKEKDKIKNIAIQISNLEKRYVNGENVNEEMEKVIANLSLEEMLAIDTYIQEKKLLTK